LHGDGLAQFLLDTTGPGKIQHRLLHTGIRVRVIFLRGLACNPSLSHPANDAKYIQLFGLQSLQVIHQSVNTLSHKFFSVGR
jgi:hypothetical protein